jgi:hypothetical protein
MEALKSFDGFKPSLQVRIVGLNDVVGGRTIFNFFVRKKFIRSLNDVNHNSKESFIVTAILVIDVAKEGFSFFGMMFGGKSGMQFIEKRTKMFLCSNG